MSNLTVAAAIRMISAAKDWASANPAEDEWGWNIHLLAAGDMTPAEFRNLLDQWGPEPTDSGWAACSICDGR